MRRVRRIGLGVSIAAVAACAPRASRAPSARLPGDPTRRDDVVNANFGRRQRVRRPSRAPTCRSRSRSRREPPAIRIRYCYDTPAGTTLDMGVYEPLMPDDPCPVRPSGAAGAAARSRTSRSPRTASRRRRPTRPTARRYVARLHDPRLPTGPAPAGAAGPPSSGIAAVGAAPVDYRSESRPARSPDWSNHPTRRATDSGAVANPSAGWYAGDVHAHGEQEPGNALVSTSLDYAFKPLAQGGAGLDWIGLVDHNNDVSRGEIGKYEPSYPGQAGDPRDRGDHLPRPLQLDRVQRLP